MSNTFLKMLVQHVFLACYIRYHLGRVYSLPTLLSLHTRLFCCYCEVRYTQH